MAELKNDPNVDWAAVQEVHEEWYEASEGLGPAAGAVIAIAIGIATQGIGAGLLTSAGATTTTTVGGVTTVTGLGTITTTTAATATAAGTTTVVSTTAGYAASAAFTALVQQAGLSLINNKGNLGAVFSELASTNTVRAVAAASLTAGLLDKAGASNLDVSSDFFAEEAVIDNLRNQLIGAGITSGVDATIGGGDLKESLVGNLRFAGAAVLGAQLSQEIGVEFAKNKIDPSQGISRGVQLIAHAVTGCAVGAVGTGNCGAGAGGQLAGEIAGLLYKGDMSPAEIDAQTQEWKNRGVDLARLSGALAAAVAGGGADDVNLGSDAGGTAAANNALCGGACIALAAVALSAAYAASQGENLNPLDGLQSIGRGEDPIGQAIAKVYDGATDQIAVVAAGAFPEQTQEAFYYLKLRVNWVRWALNTSMGSAARELAPHGTKSRRAPKKVF